MTAAEGDNAPLDPRFDARYQRGYGGERTDAGPAAPGGSGQVDAPESMSLVVPPQAPGNRSDAASGPPLRSPDPVVAATGPNIAGAGAIAAAVWQDGAPDSVDPPAAESSARHGWNPFLIALPVLSVLFVVAGAWLAFENVRDPMSFSSEEFDLTDVALDQVRSGLQGGLLVAGPLGLVVWLGLLAVRRR